MSITDDARPESRPQSPGGPGGHRRRPSGGGGPPRDGGFDKSPPQDIAAEQSVLGGMLLSKDAIADVVEILKTPRLLPAGARARSSTPSSICTAGASRPTRVTVAAALADSGDLQRIGGVPYLHTLIESVPTAANASYYARIVSERAVLRRLVEAGTKIVQLGYGTGGNGGRDVDDIVDLAQQAVYDVTETPGQRGLRGPRRHAPADPGRDRGGRRHRRHDDRRADRLHRPRPPAQRPAPRPADHRGRPPRSRQVDREHGLRPQRGDPAATAPAPSSRWK